MISAKGLSKSYGDFRAIEDLSFEIADNTVVGFLGANGAGKSTTMRILACYLPPTAGRAWVAGFDCFTESVKVRESLGYLPESVPLYMDMRVGEYLDYMAVLKGVHARDRAVAVSRAMERCRIADRRRKTMNTLSKGYRQRVGLASTLIHNPSVLILDEPTVGLDPVEIRETREMIKQLAEEHTVLLSTHILSEVENVCTHLIIIRDGRILADAAKKELVASESRTHIDVEAEAPSGDALCAALRGLEGVESVEVRDDGAAAEARCRVHVQMGADIRAAVSRALAEKGWLCLGLDTAQEKLEDIYVRITETEKVI